MPQPPQPGAAAARRAWERLTEAGGVVSRADLKEHWQLTPQRVAQLTALDDFPQPCSPGRGALWLTADVEHWRSQHETRPARRGPRAALTPLETADQAAARGAWTALQRAGGIASVRELAAKSNENERTITNHVKRPDFPDAVAPGRWLVAEVDRWRDPT